MGTRMCGNVGAVDKEKTSLHVDCLSKLHDPGQISRGRPFLPKKWVLGDHFSTENFGPGDQNFQDQNSGDRPTMHDVTMSMTHVSKFKLMFSFLLRPVL